MSSDCVLRGLDGIDALLNRLGPERMAQASAKALAEELETVRAQAEALCPKDTGALARSLCVHMEAADGEAVGTVSSSLPYAVPVEMGAADRPAQPFLYPAFAAQQPGMAQHVLRAITGR